MGDLGTGISGLGSMVMAGASAGATLEGDSMQIQAQEAMQGAQNVFNANQVAQQEGYQTQMANTTYQRGVADMQAAGINPMLAYMKGGDPAPSGAAASAAPAPQVPNFAGDAANSALQGYKASQEAQQRDAQTTNIKATQAILDHQADKEAANARTAEVGADAAEYSLDAAKAEADLTQKRAKSQMPYTDQNALVGDGGSISSVIGRVAGRVWNSAKVLMPGIEKVNPFMSDSDLLQQLHDAGSDGIAYPTPNN